MLEQEIQKLTAAIEALTIVMRTQMAEKSSNADQAYKQGLQVGAIFGPRQIPTTTGPEPQPDVPPDADPEPGCTREGLKEISLQIVRADTSKKKEIVDILEKHGAPTITKLADSEIHAVHGKFLALAHQVAREAKE